MRYFYDLEFIEDGRTIDIISLGMVAEDGRTYYAQHRDCRFRRASTWVRANVLPHLSHFDLKRLRPCDGYYDGPGAWNVWRTRAQMADDLRRFCDPDRYGTPELWGYYAAYDHVALCQLFGTMMDLPAGWPMWTHDLMHLCETQGNPRLPEQDGTEHNALADARWNQHVYAFLMAQSAGYVCDLCPSGALTAITHCRVCRRDICAAHVRCSHEGESLCTACASQTVGA